MKLHASSCTIATCLIAASIGGGAEANERANLNAALRQIYTSSTIEVQSSTVEGRIARQGVLLRLEAEGISAKPFRVAQANTKSPRFHVEDYALVKIAQDRLVTIEPGDLSLPRGTKLVVLDVKADRGKVRLRTHTSQPVRRADGAAAYGCTEFILALDRAPAGAADTDRAQRSIERWLSRQS